MRKLPTGTQLIIDSVRAGLRFFVKLYPLWGKLGLFILFPGELPSYKTFPWKLPYKPLTWCVCWLTLLSSHTIL